MWLESEIEKSELERCMLATEKKLEIPDRNLGVFDYLKLQ